MKSNPQSATSTANEPTVKGLPYWITGKLLPVVSGGGDKMQLYVGIDPYTEERSITKLTKDSKGDLHFSNLSPAEAIALAPKADQLYSGYSLVGVDDFVWNVNDIFKLS